MVTSPMVQGLSTMFSLQCDYVRNVKMAEAAKLCSGMDFSYAKQFKEVS